MGDFRISGSIRHMPVDTRNNQFRYLKLDPTSHALLTISNPHYEVHEGDSYWINHSASLANGANLTIAFATPASPDIHMVLDVEATASGTFYVYESVTSYSGGAAYTPYNRDRGSSNTSSLTSVVVGTTAANPITLTGGTAIFTQVFSVGNGVIWDRQSGEEIILKPSTKYAVRVTNGAVASVASMLLDYYEHTAHDVPDES